MRVAKREAAGMTEQASPTQRPPNMIHHKMSGVEGRDRQPQDDARFR